MEAADLGGRGGGVALRPVSVFQTQSCNHVKNTSFISSNPHKGTGSKMTSRIIIMTIIIMVESYSALFSNEP